MPSSEISSDLYPQIVSEVRQVSTTVSKVVVAYPSSYHTVNPAYNFPCRQVVVSPVGYLLYCSPNMLHCLLCGSCEWKYLPCLFISRHTDIETKRVAPVIASWPWIDSFPSFLHTAAFSFISLGLLKRVSRSGLLIPFFWLVVNLGFEFGQRYSGFGYF